MTKPDCFLLPRTFVEHAEVLMGSVGRRKMNSRSFKSWFGTTSVVCSRIWNLSPRSNTHNGKPYHLLWALILLKHGGNQDVLSDTLRVDPKTFRKWAWRYVSIIASLESKVVSTQ